MSLAILFISFLISIDTNYYHNRSLKETRTKIAIIDTGIDLNKAAPFLCNGVHYDLTKEGIGDTFNHGTNIAGIIAKKMDVNKQCLLIVKYYSNITPGLNFLRTLIAYKLLLKENVSFINYSTSGWGSNILEDMHQEKLLLQEIVNNKIYFTTAAGNNETELSKSNCNYFPACYNFNTKYFRVVGNGKSQKERQSMSNYGEIVTDWKNGKNVEGFGISQTGTSQSTAVLTSELIGQ